MINVNFVGRLGNDSEIRESNGKQFISMRVAVDDYNFSTKEKVTQWVNVTSHNTNVMNMQQYLKKGSSVMVLGRSRMRTYVNKDQVVVPTMDVFADRIEFVGGSSKDESEEAPKGAVCGTLINTQASAVNAAAEAARNSNRTVLSQNSVSAVASTTDTDDLPF